MFHQEFLLGRVTLMFQLLSEINAISFDLTSELSSPNKQKLDAKEIPLGNLPPKCCFFQ